MFQGKNISTPEEIISQVSELLMASHKDSFGDLEYSSKRTLLGKASAYLDKLKQAMDFEKIYISTMEDESKNREEKILIIWGLFNTYLQPEIQDGHELYYLGECLQYLQIRGFKPGLLVQTMKDLQLSVRTLNMLIKRIDENYFGPGTNASSSDMLRNDFALSSIFDVLREFKRNGEDIAQLSVSSILKVIYQRGEELAKIQGY